MPKLPMGLLFYTVAPITSPAIQAWCLAAWQHCQFSQINGLLAHHKLLPTLEYCLQQHQIWEQVPAEIQQFIQQSRQRYGLRQLQAISQLTELDAALSTVGIEAVLLKGSALLYYPLYPSLGSRSQSDIDLLVAPDQVVLIVPILQKLGYVFQGVYEEGRHYPHHLPPLVRPNCLHIEVHPLQSGLGQHIHQQMLATAQEIAGFGALRLPVVTELFWHVALHAKIGSCPQLRNLLDLHRLRELYVVDALLLTERARNEGLEPLWSELMSELEEFSQGQLTVKTIRDWEWVPSPIVLGPYIGLRAMGWPYFFQSVPFKMHRIFWVNQILSTMLFLPFVAWRLIRAVGLAGEYLLRLWQEQSLSNYPKI
jgi:Uncharacterised nucleotidyltransferase